MTSAVKESKVSKTRRIPKKERPMPVATPSRGRIDRGKRERVLVEFPESLLKRADEAASRMEKNRSELIRTAVERLLELEEKKKFEMELALAYAANAQMNQDLAEEFSFIDREGF